MPKKDAAPAAAAASEEFENIDDFLAEHLPAEKLREVRRVLYGTEPAPLKVSEKAAAALAKANFELKAFAFEAKPEVTRPNRVVRIGAVQHIHPCDPAAPVDVQQKAVLDMMLPVIDAAGEAGVNVLCLQEAWNIPFFFCTREKHPWMQFAESAEDGPTTKLLCKYAKKWNMVIISPILERDLKHQDRTWNTAVVISNHGHFLGKSRKNHIPRVGDFNEAHYYIEGDMGHPVFATDFGKIGINICYGRHHPQNWMMFALNGAEICFNPSATVGKLSEPMWGIEARNAAIANSMYTVAINRVGTEIYPNPFTSGTGQAPHHDFGHFYGSSYVAAPNAGRSPGLSRTRNGLLIADCDLNMCTQVRDNWGFSMTQRVDLYAKSFTAFSQHDFEPQVVYDKHKSGAAGAGPAGK